MLRKLDDTNKMIIREMVDGRKSFSAIADEMKITENTVRTRVNKMLEDGVLRVMGLVDPELVPGLQVVIMAVKLKTLELETKAREFSALRGVISAAVVTGRYDLIVELILNEEENLSLLDFFKTELVRIEDVLEVETFVVYQSHSLYVPYIL